MDTQQVAQNFFNCAAQQGYGPGYGALADYALNGRRKNLRRAAQYFGYPTSLAGRDGKRWSKNAADLLAYREQNVRSGRQTLLLVVVTLVITLLASSRICDGGSGAGAGAWLRGSLRAGTGYGPLRLLPLCVCRPGCLLAAEHPMPGLRGGTV